MKNSMRPLLVLLLLSSPTALAACSEGGDETNAEEAELACSGDPHSEQEARAFGALLNQTFQAQGSFGEVTVTLSDVALDASGAAGSATPLRASALGACPAPARELGISAFLSVARSEGASAIPSTIVEAHPVQGTFLVRKVSTSDAGADWELMFRDLTEHLEQVTMQGSALGADPGTARFEMLFHGEDPNGDPVESSWWSYTVVE